MARSNPIWGEERIVAELLLKLDIRVSPRTARQYMPEHWDLGHRTSSQHCMTFVRNHAKAMLASDFFLVVTARFQILYVIVATDVGSRKIAHCNVAAHPTADWTLQQFREVITGEPPYRFLIHDRDSIYSPGHDSAMNSMCLRVLKMPVHAPQANAFCEQLVGTIRRKCLDFLIPLNEKHLRRILREWVTHYNQGRPHSSLGPGIPDPPTSAPLMPCAGHFIPDNYRGVPEPILGGLHHEYRFEKIAA